MRAVLEGVLRLVLRLYFRTIVVRGLDQLPPDGRLIFVLNHPNGLVDPLFVLLKSGRRVSFLAKAPLFRLPVLGYFLRLTQTIPVYRPEDNPGDTARNLETFARARQVLTSGLAIAIFPEGTTHSDPSLKPLRTGAARIALAATADGPVTLVPAGLTYSNKARFRSRATVQFGAPIVLPAGAAPEPDALDPEAVQALTQQLRDALGEVTVQADRAEIVDLLARTTRLLAPRSDPDAAFVLHRRIAEGYALLRDRDPLRLARLRHRVERHLALLDTAGIPPESLESASYRPQRVALFTAHRIARILLLVPLGVPGLVVHAPAWVMVGRLAHRYAKGASEVVSTAQILGGMLLYPLTWIGLAAVAYLLFGPVVSGLALVLTPVSGYAALRLMEQADSLVTATRGYLFFVAGREGFQRLAAAQTALRADLEAVGREGTYMG